MPRIVISVTNDLTTDQRVLKTCESFNELGYEILLIGRKLKNSSPVIRPYKTYRFNLLFNKGFLFYAEYNIKLFIKLLFVKKDLLLANDLDTLLPNFMISKIASVKLIYDSHEYFTEVPELISRPLIKSFWGNLEKLIFPKLKNVLTVNYKIAEIYKKEYNVPISVIRNFPKRNYNYSKEQLGFSTKNKQLIVYQGAINIGRGLELMIESMAFLKNHILIIVGEGDILFDLKRRVKQLKMENQVVFLGRIQPERLPNITRMADLGISLEEDLGLNYHYSLPNKLFDYIQAEIPVLVSDLPLVKEIINTYKVGEVLTERKPASLAKLIKQINVNRKDYTSGLEKAALNYNWENEKINLVKFIQKIE